MTIRKWIMVAAAVICMPALAFADAAELSRIQQQIIERGYDWVATETWPSSLTPEARANLSGLKLPEDYIEPVPDASMQALSLPSRFDWREHSGVTAIRNQGQCGACWAFAALAAFESAVKIAGGGDHDLSEQQLVSCNTSGASCEGGWFETAYDLMRDNGSIAESCMPYKQNDDEPCRQSQCQVIARAGSWEFLATDVGTLKNAIMQRPVSVGMTVFDDFSYYGGGCYENPNDAAINHGVLLIGWDDSVCGGAWIVKNSWGKNWGENGFAHIKFGTCRIGKGASRPWYPGGSTNPTPTPNPTSASTPADVAVELLLSGDHFSEGYFFQLGLGLRNRGAAVSVDVAICMEIGGAYYFWPTWQTSIQTETIALGAGEHFGQVILAFEWPAGNFGASELAIYAAAFLTGSYDLIDYQVAEIAYD